MNVGKSIEIARAQKGWKSYELAEKLGIAPASLSALKKRESCTGDMLGKLCDVFDVKASEFIALGE